LIHLDRARFDSGNWKGTTLAQDKAKFDVGRAENKWCSYWHIFVWEIMRQSMGDVCMYESLVLDPAWIHDFNRVYTDFFKSHFIALFEDQGLPDGIKIAEDLAYKNGLFASPKMLADLVFPYYAELVAFFHSYGLPVLLHTCGDVTAALPLIVDAGFDGLNPMEVKAGCDLFEYAETYGDQLVFIGGLDVRVLETNDRELITREVVRVVEGMKSRGARYVFGSDHSVTPLVTYDTYQHALDVYREHMWY
jgi:uroporphyrinogen decarboxylase